MEPRRREVKRLPHHEQDDLCTTRPPYRQGRKLTAVKVYTVNDESQHLIVSGVPALGLQDDLRKLFRRFGDIKALTFIPNYANEQFVEGYHVHYARIQSARFAKRQGDGRAFFGGSLLVCYAPEMESVTETRNKLMQRRHDVARRCMSNSGGHYPVSPDSRSNLTEGKSNDSSVRDYSQDACVWNGIVTKHDPRLLVPAKELEKVSAANYGPQPLASNWTDVGVREVIVKHQPLKRCSAALLSVPKKVHVKQTLPLNFQNSRNTQKGEAVSDPPTKSETIESPVLRFVPSQVKQAHKRIIFHPTSRTTLGPDTGNISLDNTIQTVRERIRAVGVPNVKLLLEKNLKLPDLCGK